MKKTSGSKRFVGVIQARLGSTRLPEKMLLEIAGIPIVEWVLRRVKNSSLLDHVWLATSTLRENDVLEEIAKNHNVSVFRGEEQNVFSRFQEITNATGASHVVRICADNPLVCPFEIDRVIELAREHPESYCFNHIPRMGNNYVDGAGAEVVPKTYMNYMAEQSLSEQDLEHVTKHIWDRKQLFNLETIQAPPELSYPDIRLDVDSLADYKLMKARVEQLKDFKTPEELRVSELVKWVADHE